MGFLIAIFARLGASQRLARVLGVIVPLALVGACMAFLWARGDHYRHQRDHTRDQLAVANMKLATSNASITRLQAALNTQNAAIEQQGRAYETAKQSAAVASARLDAQAKDNAARIARLQALSKGVGPCPVNAETRKLAEGL